MEIYNLEDISLKDLKYVGGKAANLGELLHNNYNVPKGFVCTKLEKNENVILKKIDDLKIKKIAVRSSAICEDGKQNSFAGQYETFLNINKNNLISCIRKCFDAVNNENVKNYLKERKIESLDNKMSVIIQEMINGETSGVIFTRNPINGRDDIIIECVKGLGERLVQGEVTPTQICINRDGKITQTTGDKILTAKTIKKLSNIAINIENYYCNPQDIEFTIKNDNIYILQTRTITKY